MKPNNLLSIISGLSDAGPLHKALEVKLKIGVGFGNAWYSSQKEHWEGWLEEYDGPGAYGRKGQGKSAEFAYNQIQCPPMLVWLAEASGVDSDAVTAGCAAIIAAPPRATSRCAAFRKIVPWEIVEAHLHHKSATTNRG